MTVKLIALPAARLAALTAKCVAAAGVTVMAPLAPAIESFAVSAAEIVWLPEVFSVAERTDAAGQRGVGGQDCRRVAAGEMDCARVAGGRVIVSVFGGHGDRKGVARGYELNGIDEEMCGRGRATLTAPLAGDRAIERVGGGRSSGCRRSSA